MVGIIKWYNQVDNDRNKVALKNLTQHFGIVIRTEKSAHSDISLNLSQECHFNFFNYLNVSSLIKWFKSIQALSFQKLLDL
ncbi:hypothetical protein QQ008_28840 [Fulvivirgaceae bacterium BMA10]|uniref:LAGLIDADG homing endonuclease n=1 Tax=Splendidivirga corallicola TaxID=3051826 RepID=A0ABT8KZT3_9BACT|nr:hypothetical protein [Fulvivirgaceae bacterium BMA10]